MSNKISPISKAEVRSRFQKNVNSLATSAKNVQEGLQNKTQFKQPVLDKNGWDGNVLGIADIGKPWERKENEDDLVNAIKDASSPGVVGDLMSSTLQGDWLATQERAFRARNMSKIRAAMHAASRRYGHGHDAGVFKKGVLDYIKYVTKMSKDSRS